MAADPIDSTQIACSVEEARLRISDNWKRVCADVADAASHSNRDPAEVRVVGVSKYVDAEITSWLIDAGCRDLGENRPQVLMQKADWFATNRGDVAGEIRWHQIGHLQRNKVRRLLSTCPTIHSVDSERVLEEIHREAVRQSIGVDVLIEVNVSGEAAKTGLPPDELAGAVERHVLRMGDANASDAGVRLIGLMAMAGWGTDPQQARPQFARLRELRDQMRLLTKLEWPELSMGMSGDYEAAIAEGATMVRIGSSLFTGVMK
ncbi:YggS family pyridoxal phosphate-dependent enzyme [Aporhodopirellula aestuarii]|uniref:Pyridoxal phosphate homeostasis protein n=1 Tax=Aporhodopirellula aestuarii TaxID=2950107 RepID=A0ABT0U3J0_9BACT|nr:YggS family pyridoxal phosphate-dependent enzyme [Aporhodopirellula aestuarii]MCM2371464.1 YggS family pyridoxal phosphate-dependent enzyme [Aporhodopirellula aestuarii]